MFNRNYYNISMYNLLAIMSYCTSKSLCLVNQNIIYQDALVMPNDVNLQERA
jgi:hypothetical protein